MRRLISLLMGVTICCALAFPAHPQTASDASASQVTKLKVITYNVQFLPGLASAKNERREPKYRAQRIAQEMSKFDIVALQEVFEDRHRESIIAGVRSAWAEDLHLVESPKPEGFFTNGGCALLSRFPIIESNSVVFKNFSKPEEYGISADGHAAKGVIHARIAHDKNVDDYIDVFVTHLEAKADHLRPLQYIEFADFVRKHSDPDRPALFLGDFNTKGTLPHRNDSESQYNALMQALRASRPNSEVSDVWPLLMGNAHGGTSKQESAEVGKRIDYIFLVNPNARNNQITPTAIHVDTYRDERVYALSDHNAVAAEFEWPMSTIDEQE